MSADAPEQSRQPPGATGPSRREVALRLLIAYRWHVGLAIGVVALVAVTSDWQPPQLVVPRWARVAALAFAGTVVLAALPAMWLVSWLYAPSYTYLLDFDPAVDELAIWELSPSAWRSLVVEDGELFPVRAGAPMWAAGGYDPEAHVAEGYWKGTASDIELAEHEQAVHEVRGQLEELAEAGLGIRVRQSSIVRSAVTRILHRMVGTFEEGALFDGEAVGDAVERELEGWNLESEQRVGEAPGDDGEETAPSMDAASEFDYEEDGAGAVAGEGEVA